MTDQMAAAVVTYLCFGAWVWAAFAGRRLRERWLFWRAERAAQERRWAAADEAWRNLVARSRAAHR